MRISATSITAIKAAIKSKQARHAKLEAIRKDCPIEEMGKKMDEIFSLSSKLRNPKDEADFKKNERLSSKALAEHEALEKRFKKSINQDYEKTLLLENEINDLKNDLDRARRYSI